MSLRQWCGSAALVLALATQPISSVAQGPSPSAGPSPLSVPADRLAVYPDLAWDEPTPAVLAERCRQESLISGMDAAIAYTSGQLDFAGVAYQRTGPFRTTFWFTGDLEAHSAALMGLAPAGMIIEILPAQLTLSGLRAIQRVITLDERKLRRRGVVISTVGTDLDRNPVEVGLRRPNDDAEMVLRRRYGPHVVTDLIGPITEDGAQTPAPAP